VSFCFLGGDEMRSVKSLFVIQFLLIISIIVLEILPYGTALKLLYTSNGVEGYVTKTFSYFDFSFFLHYNFAPMITAAFSIIVFIIIIINFLKSGNQCSRLILIPFLISFIASIISAAFNLTVTSIIISVLMAFLLVLQVKKGKEQERGN